MLISDWIIYKNNQFIAFNKPGGIPVQPDQSGQKSLLELGKIYCKSDIYLTHRIDQPASGVVLFAYHAKGVAAINRQFQERIIQKTYLAIVANPPEKAAGVLTHFLRKNGKTNRSQAYDEPIKGGKKAVLHYELLGKSDRYFLLKIDLETGRHHQIRSQLSKINCSIKGDIKYGARRSNRDRSIHLHAWKLQFQHPVNKEKVILEAPLPRGVIWGYFAELLKNKKRLSHK